MTEDIIAYDAHAPGTRSRLAGYLPLLVFLVMAVFFAIGLTMNPRDIPSPLIGKPVPEFSLPPVKGGTLGLSSADLRGEVAVTAKPLEVSAGAATWTFQVTLKTHSQELNDDLARVAYIVDEAGKKTPATGWEGNAPGGHDRKGILRFKALTPPPGALELHIQRPGETAPRTFRWKLK